jgi:hypothetical protein
MGRILESKIVVLLLVGVTALIVSRIIKRGRTAEEQAGVLENILWVGGFLITAASLIYALSRGCNVDVPKKKNPDTLQEYSRETPGCSKPKKKLKDYKR